MKKHFTPLLTLCLLLSGCSGLPAAREMGDMALLRTRGGGHRLHRPPGQGPAG